MVGMSGTNATAVHAFVSHGSVWTSGPGRWWLKVNESFLSILYAEHAWTRVKLRLSRRVHVIGSMW